MADSLLETIEADLKTALKSKNREELDALRLLKSDIQLEIGRGSGDSLSDAEVSTLIKRAVKRRKDSIEQFQKAGKDAMAAEEQAGLAILERYLPEGLGEDAIRQVVQEVLTGMGDVGPGDMGKVMGAVMGKLKGQDADGAVVKQIVQASLNA